MEYDFEVISIDRKSKISFTLEEYMHERLPSFSCTLDIEDYGFRGWNKNVWFEIDEIKNTLKQLKTMEHNRSEKAEIEAMSEDEFILTVEGINSKGDLLLRYMIRHNRYAHSERYPITLNGCFEFDSEYFDSLINAISKLVSLEELGQSKSFE